MEPPGKLIHATFEDATCLGRFEVMAILASSTSPRLARRWGLKRVLLYGLGSDLIAMLLLVLSRFVQHESDIAFAFLLAATGALGLGFGATLMALNTFAQGLSPAHKDRAVLTLNALLGTGTALAPALVALFLALGAWWLLPVCVSCALAALLFLIANESLQLPTEEVASSGEVAGRGRKPPPHSGRLRVRYCFTEFSKR